MATMVSSRFTGEIVAGGNADADFALWNSSGQRLRSGLVVFGVDNQATSSTFALAFRTKAGVIAQREMDYPALAGRHWSELVGHSSLEHSFGGDISGDPKLFKPHRSLIHAVKAYFFVLVARKVKHLQRQ